MNIFVQYLNSNNGKKNETSENENDSNSLQNEMNSIINLNKLDELINDQASCDLCDGLFDELPKFNELIENLLKDYEFNTFLIGCKLDSDQTSHEEELWSKTGAKNPELLKGEFNRELGKIVEAHLNKEVDFDTPDITILVDTRYDDISLKIGSLFIYGRYKKFKRDIPQTKWPCKRCWGKGCENCNGTGKIYDTSVEEQIAAKVMTKTKGKKHLFHGMGREDISVRMLGNGRPFILEITEPIYRNLDLELLEKEINEYAKSKVEVSDLSFSNNREVRALKAAKHSKTYLVTINFEKKIEIGKLKSIVSTFRGQTIKQRTPERVSHRRADLVRERKVIDMAVKTISKDGKTAEFEITGESGLYIKELVHGDSKRTSPSIAEYAGCDCSVDALDVVRINDN
jgi:tRNA pseudouridine synthase 10